MRKAIAPKSVPAAVPLMRIVGEVVKRPIGSVRKNSWNPNEFTPHMMASLKHGLKEDGWVISQSMLIWGLDDKGVRRDIIIDGEHRWIAAQELGFTEAPMVFQDGLSEAQAKALTIKLDAKRGKFGWKLDGLVQELNVDLGVPDLGMELGFEKTALEDLLADDSPDLEGATKAPTKPKGTGEGSAGTRATVQYNLVFGDEEEQRIWYAFIKRIRQEPGKTISARVTGVLQRLLDGQLKP